MHGKVADPSTANACAELCATVVASALSLKCRVSIATPSGADTGGATFELVAARERPRGVTIPNALGVVAIDDPGALIVGNPLARVHSGGFIAVPTAHSDAGGLWEELPAYVKAIAFDRGVRILGLPALHTATGGDVEAHRWMVAAAFAGVALFAFGALGGPHPTIDGSLVERDVASALRVLHAPSSIVEKAGRLARRLFDAPLEVPRATVEHDLPAVRLGRHDARASVPGG
jgi:hypothetical protein